MQSSQEIKKTNTTLDTHTLTHTKISALKAGHIKAIHRHFSSASNQVELSCSFSSFFSLVLVVLRRGLNVFLAWLFIDI